MEPQLSSNKEETESETAIEKSAGQSTASSPCRASRGRGDGCFNTEVTCPPETNGAATSATGSGRVLRDRSTRTIPVWRQTDISEDLAEVSRDASGNRRRKAKCPRRRKSPAAAAASSDAGKDSGGDCDLLDDVEKKEEESMDDDVVEEEECPFVDDPKDENYRPQSNRIPSVRRQDKHSTMTDSSSDSDEAESSSQIPHEGEETISSDEDVPFRDDLNDQSYDPKDFSKSKRRPHTRLKEKKDKPTVQETPTAAAPNGFCCTADAPSNHPVTSKPSPPSTLKPPPSSQYSPPLPKPAQGTIRLQKWFGISKRSELLFIYVYSVFHYALGD